MPSQVIDAALPIYLFMDSKLENVYVELDGTRVKSGAAEFFRAVRRLEDAKLEPGQPRESWGKPRCRRCGREVVCQEELRYAHCIDCLSQPGVAERAQGLFAEHGSPRVRRAGY